jgi:hypothetical protein
MDGAEKSLPGNGCVSTTGGGRGAIDSTERATAVIRETREI